MTDEVRKAVRVALAERDWTRTELAKRADLHKQTVSDMLNGKNEGKLETWQKMLEPLGLMLEIGVTAREAQDA